MKSHQINLSRLAIRTVNASKATGGIVATMQGIYKRSMSTAAPPQNRIRPSMPMPGSVHAEMRTPHLSAAQRQNHVQPISYSEGRSVRMALEISKSISDELMPINEAVRSRICVVRRENQKRDLLQGWKHPARTTATAQQSPNMDHTEDVSEEILGRKVNPLRRQINIAKPMEQLQTHTNRAVSKPSSSRNSSSTDLKRRKAFAMQRYVYTSTRRNSRALQHDQRMRLSDSQPSASISLEDFELMDVPMARGAPKRPSVRQATQAQEPSLPVSAPAPAEKREEPTLVTYQRYDQPKKERDFLRKHFFGGMDPPLLQLKSKAAVSAKKQPPVKAARDGDDSELKEPEDSFVWTNMKKGYVQAEADREASERNVLRGTLSTSRHTVPKRLDDIHYPSMLFGRRDQSQQVDSDSTGHPSNDNSKRSVSTGKPKPLTIGQGKMRRKQVQDENRQVYASSSVVRLKVPEASHMSSGIFSQDSSIVNSSSKFPKNEVKPFPKKADDDQYKDAELDIAMPEKYVKESAFQRFGGPVIKLRHSRVKKW
ncbi:uncharacterized protein LOC117586544 [Drosophila guanche]|uniref:Uncharacterized protein n=1 Tax=Drosophila guanche TaxID=7266 RepID=A0A3B0KLD8_DROGU|nr:uncharacterized protein LOC117586544 [Drosophila guanche]SPP84628.1 Hypothetical predicted protein [Drosophila guanche]